VDTAADQPHVANVAALGREPGFFDATEQHHTVSQTSQTGQILLRAALDIVDSLLADTLWTVLLGIVGRISSL